KQQRGKKDPMLNAQLLKRKARGSHCQRGKGNQRRSKLTITNPDAAGIDLGAQVHYAAVSEGRDQVSVRSFGAYTAQLDELVQWFKDCGIKTVVMESTGVYWIPLYQKLEEAGFEVLLVDAQQAKHVPGRKSDVQDCQWLQPLPTYGVLRAAVVAAAVAHLRVGTSGVSSRRLQLPLTHFATTSQELGRMRGDVDSAHAEGSQRDEPALASRAE